MAARLVLSIVSTLIWETMLVALWRWGLPALGIRLHLSVLVAAMVVLAIYAVVSFRIGTRALNMKAIIGMSDMLGSKGKVVITLTPAGMVRIGSELWLARSLEGGINKGEEVTVVEQTGLKLFVRKSDDGKLAGNE